MNGKWSRVPWGVIGMLALLFLGERMLSRCETAYMLPQHWDWRQAAKAATSAEVVRSEVLCFGDSLMKQSVQPIVIEAKTGHPTYNLAVAMGQPSASYFLLRRALRAGAKPKLILLDAAPFVISMSPDDPSMMRQWPELLNGEERLDLARTLGSVAFFARVSLAQHWPSLRLRGDIRGTAVAWASGENVVALRCFQMAQFLRNGRVNRGANAMRYVAGQPFDIGPASEHLFETFRFHPVNVAYLERFLDLAAAHGIPVVGMLTPPAPLAQKHTEANGFEHTQTLFFQWLQGRHRGLKIADARRSNYGAELHYMDPIHLNLRGAVALSDDLAKVVAQVIARRPLPPHDWVMLPAYEDRQRGVEVEDIDASAMAIADPGRDKLRR